MPRKIVNSTTLSQRGKLILFFVHLYVFSGVIQIVSANECDTRVALVVSIQGVVDVRAQEEHAANKSSLTLLTRQPNRLGSASARLPEISGK